MAFSPQHVAELQGLYGPFTMGERVVQKMWLRQDFSRDRLLLADGRSLVVRASGAWNLLGGPDFLRAHLLVDGRELTGDVEVHFHAADWRSHRHAADPAYDNVTLHVVLFPPDCHEQPARRRDGSEIPLLVLLPLLHRDLEEYASDDALEGMTSRDEWEHFSALASIALPGRLALVREFALRRWREKVHFAGVRIARLGWTEAAHHTALEILGYRRNRSAMLAVAGRYPLAAWARGVEPELVLESGRPYWQMHGLRPANQPLARLRQYQRLILANPEWPQALDEMDAAVAVPETGDGPTAPYRRMARLAGLRKTFAGPLLGGAIGGRRLDNLICDGLLPLLAAGSPRDFWPVWFHWFLGDVPDQVRRMLPKLGLADGRTQPQCQGLAQGLIGWILQEEARASDRLSKNLPGA